MNDNEITQAKEELRALQEQINTSKKKLSDLNQKKEHWFTKRAEFGGQIAERIRDVKETRQRRDALTQAVQAQKKERRSFSQDIREKIAEVKRMRNDRKKRLEELGVQKKPHGLKKEIEQLEFKLETTPMGFKEEKRLTKLIKEKKAQNERFSEVAQLSKRIREMSKEIDDLKKESDVVHENLREKAEGSQEFHETVIESSKQIDELKANEDSAYKKFSDHKEEYLAEKNNLQELIDKAEGIRSQLGEAGELPEQIDKKAAKKIIQEKSAEVEEKVKKKEKLTTEDLLAFQAGD